MPDKKENQELDKRRVFLQVACAIYLIYLSYKLANVFFNSIGLDGWTATNILSICAAIIFALSAVILIVVNVKKYFKATLPDSDESKEGEEK